MKSLKVYAHPAKVTICSGIFLCASFAYADETQNLEIAKNRFDAGEYEDAAKRLSSLLDPTLAPCSSVTDPKAICHLEVVEHIEMARAFFAASLVALGREADADHQIETILRANPAYSPNPATFPNEVVDRFTVVRARIRTELEALARKKAEEERKAQLDLQKRKEAEAKRIAQLLQLASEEHVVQKNSRWIALIPFGVGQFQNGDTNLGIFLATSEMIAGATSIVFAGLVSDYSTTDVNAIAVDGSRVDRSALNDQIETFVMFNRVAFGTWAALTATGIAQAQIAFVPEKKTTRKRPLPPSLITQIAVVPEVSPTHGGIGVVGSF